MEVRFLVKTQSLQWWVWESVSSNTEKFTQFWNTGFHPILQKFSGAACIWPSCRLFYLRSMIQRVPRFAYEGIMWVTAASPSVQDKEKKNKNNVAKYLEPLKL